MSHHLKASKIVSSFVMDIVIESRAENVQEWNAIGCKSSSGVVIERTVVSA